MLEAVLLVLLPALLGKELWLPLAGVPSAALDDALSAVLGIVAFAATELRVKMGLRCAMRLRYWDKLAGSENG